MRKQRSIESLGDEQRMRKSAIRTDLLRVFGVLPSRSLPRAAERQARISTRVASACWRAAGRAGLSLVRSNNIQVAR